MFFLIYSASIFLNWEDDSEIYDKLNNQSNQDPEMAPDEQKTSVPIHLNPWIRRARFLFVFIFMLTDAILTIKNVCFTYLLNCKHMFMMFYKSF